MTETVAALRAERENLINRVRMIDAALAKYEAWEREVNGLLTGQTPTALDNGSVAASPKPIAGPPQDEATPMPEFEDKAGAILEAADRPLMRGPFLRELHHRGVVVGGADERNTLSARLSRLEWIVNLRGHGYWLKSRDYHPAGYRADDASSPALVGEHDASAVNAAHDVME